MSGILSGKKFSSKHQTLIPCASQLVMNLKKCSAVKKIALGKISHSRSSAFKVTISIINGNFIGIKVKGNSNIQDFSLVADPVNDAICIINEFCQSEKG